MTSADDHRKIVAVIFARGGSKGVPGKNIKMFAGKPLIGWAIEHARSVKRIDRVIVSTDDLEIASVARNEGAEVPFMRPPELARDDSPEWLAWRHALDSIRIGGLLPRIMVSVPTTAPLRAADDIERCLDLFEQGDTDVVVTASPAHRNPYFNMVKENSDGTVGLVIAPEGKVHRRQDTPPVYDLTTVAYVCDPDFVMTHSSIFEGRVRAVLVPPERAIDIDTEEDFRIAEYLFLQRGRV